MPTKIHSTHTKTCSGHCLTGQDLDPNLYSIFVTLFMFNCVWHQYLDPSHCFDCKTVESKTSPSKIMFPRSIGVNLC